MSLRSENISQPCFVFFNDDLPSIAAMVPQFWVLLLVLATFISELVLSCCTRCMTKVDWLQNYVKTLVKLVHHNARAMFRMKPSLSPHTKLFVFVVPTIFLFQVFFMAGLLLGLVHIPSSRYSLSKSLTNVKLAIPF